jgi:NAD(P)-dependent dehydrogenase (short-subunit alcohol dehydrogenase family)
MTKQKTAIVTAAGRGMGAACARALAEKGYAVSLMSVSERSIELARELGGIGWQGSVTEPADLQRLVEGTMAEYGRIDAVVNNTGHPPKGELLDITDEEWRDGMDMVLLNVIRMARLVTPIMQAQGGGAIVNISTFAAFEPSLDFPVSSALRAALGSFAKLYADRYAADNIRMNNILPGYVASYEVDEKRLNTIPMHRPGAVEEIGETAVFLLSDAAGYITGQNLRVDGGITRSV